MTMRCAIYSWVSNFFDNTHPDISLYVEVVK